MPSSPLELEQQAETHECTQTPALAYVVQKHKQPEKPKRHARRKLRPVRGHPRWAPTNEQHDLNCGILLVPSAKYYKAKHRFNWFVDRSELDDVQDDLAWNKERYWNGAYRYCIKLKYLTNYKVCKSVLTEKFGPDEEISDSLYRQQHIWDFRDVPPGDLQNPKIPPERVEKVKKLSKLGYARTEEEDLVYNMEKWGRFYRVGFIRGKLKAYLNANVSSWRLKYEELKKRLWISGPENESDMMDSHSS